MSTTVTLRLPDTTYQRFLTLTKQDNRSLSNFIETGTLRYAEAEQYVDDFEMNEIQSNVALNKSLKWGLADVKAGRGQFV